MTATTSRPALPLSQRGDGRVDPAAERDQDPLPPSDGASANGWPGAGEARERAVKRVRGQDGSVAVAGPEAAELGFDLVGADARRLEHRQTLGQLAQWLPSRPRSRRSPRGRS